MGGSGLPGFSVTGNPDPSVREARDRVRAAIKNSGFTFPDLKVTVALSPADMPKVGSGFDLSMAVAILAATEQVSSEKLESAIFLGGELGLDGNLRPIRGGVLPAVIAARQAGYRRAVVPIETVAEAALVEGDGRRRCVEPQRGCRLARG